MASRALELQRAVSSFRRDHATAFLNALLGRPSERARARRFLIGEPGLTALAQAVQDREFSPSEHAAVVAHIARATIEEAFAEARIALLSFPDRSLSAEGEPRRVKQLLAELPHAQGEARRSQIFRAIDTALPELLDVLERGLARADRAASELLSRVSAPRHADAGPEGGNTKSALEFLARTDELARETVAFALRRAGLDTDDGAEALWALTGPSYDGIFAREGRLRRIAADFEPLGLRRALAAHGRLAPPHDGPFPVSHLALVNAPNDVRISPCAIDFGLSAELAAADGIGRAIAHVHASPALSPALRNPTVGSVARAFGAIALHMFTVPRFLEKQRGLSRRERDDVARLAAGYVLFDARLAAVQVLARSVNASDRRAQVAALASRALTYTLPENLGALLVTRLSPGGPFRGKLAALSIVHTLREAFDEDWFRNPRTGDPLRGAAVRAGELSVEAFAAELGADLAHGHARLSELF